ncbi:scavenger mRNA decapping enzyme [Corynespora cassiicola Philippines]|uniref:Scavenger mRNA decapping enzyme n=1 Tax=Corynespora cassiicola Philippines TaxID=1448308 RepID=A0A2T2N9V0_CORCC|nr:scavenger mRNA decapping enzyme [Corynespora cassiicola Philippines]
MADSNTISPADTPTLLPQFQLDRLLNQDQAGRRISLLGTIHSQPALLIAERAAFETTSLDHFSTSLTNIKNLGANDIYFWFLANTSPSPNSPADLKLNLIWPCQPQHIKKYSSQGLRMITETPDTYAKYVRPFMQRKRDRGALNWVYNILEGRKEQDDVIYREPGPAGFLLLPDLNWDRKTVSSLHLLCIVERRDVWSVRDLKRRDVPWVKHMREKILEATTALYPEVEADQVKLYVHYQPTYFHFHVHVVHVALEAGGTQATGKALGLENVIAQLEGMGGGEEGGMQDVGLTYHLGEQSELWEKIFLPLKEGREPDVEGF